MKKNFRETKGFNKMLRHVTFLERNTQHCQYANPSPIQSQVNIQFSCNANQNPNTVELYTVLIKPEVFWIFL